MLSRRKNQFEKERIEAIISNYISNISLSPPPNSSFPPKFLVKVSQEKSRGKESYSNKFALSI
jgi:hypothetical protein